MSNRSLVEIAATPIEELSDSEKLSELVAGQRELRALLEGLANNPMLRSIIPGLGK